MAPQGVEVEDIDTLCSNYDANFASYVLERPQVTTRRLPGGVSEAMSPLVLSHPALSWRCDQPGLVSLTFDDAPDKHVTEIAHELALLGVNATFFVEGIRAAQDPAAVAHLHRAGHQIAAHSLTHSSFLRQGGSRKFFALEIFATEAIILAALPTAARFSWQRYFRAPYLGLDPASADELFNRGYHGIDASIDTKDFDANVTHAERLLSVLARGPSNSPGIPYGSAHLTSHIVLMHANHLSAIPLLRPTVTTLRRHGYQFVRIDECVRSNASASRLAKLREWAATNRFFDNTRHAHWHRPEAHPAHCLGAVDHLRSTAFATAASPPAPQLERRRWKRRLHGAYTRRCPIDVPVFIISLPNSHRRGDMQWQLNSMQCFDYEFVAALTPDQIPEWSEASPTSWDSGSLDRATRVEFAITLSHLRAARQALRRLRRDNVSQLALIVEDDVDFAPVRAWPYSTIRKWLGAASLPQKWYCVQLGSTINKDSWTALHALSGQGLRLAVQRPSSESLVKLNLPKCSVQARDKVLWSRQFWSNMWGAFANLYSITGLEAVIKTWCDMACVRSARGAIDSLRPIHFSLKDNFVVLRGKRRAAVSENVLLSALGKSMWIAVPPLLLHNIQTASTRAKMEKTHARGKLHTERTERTVFKTHNATRSSTIEIMKTVWCQAPPGLSDSWLIRLNSAIVAAAVDFGCIEAGPHEVN